MKQTADDKRICARMKEIRELIKEFGLTLSGHDPGISAYIDARPDIKACGWNGPFKIDDVEWTWLEPLLKELSARRKGVPTFSPAQKDALLNALAYSWVRGWYAGGDGIKNDDGKREAAKEELDKLLVAWVFPEEKAAPKVCSMCGGGYGIAKPLYRTSHEGLLCHKCDRED